MLGLAFGPVLFIFQLRKHIIFEEASMMCFPFLRFRGVFYEENEDVLPHEKVFADGLVVNILDCMQGTCVMELIAI